MFCLGKEWTTTEGVLQNHNPMWVKRISRTGEVQHLDWVEAYKKLRAAAGIQYPGMLLSNDWLYFSAGVVLYSFPHYILSPIANNRLLYSFPIIFFPPSVLWPLYSFPHYILSPIANS